MEIENKPDCEKEKEEKFQEMQKIKKEGEKLLQKVREKKGENIRMTFDELDDTTIEVTSLTAREYANYCQRSLPIAEDYIFQMCINSHFDRQKPNFDYPHLYAALKTFFGESTTMYDFFKCSFGYHFQLKIKKKDVELLYILNLTDLRGYMSFFFRKMITTDEENEKFPIEHRNKLHEPLEDEFSKSDMQRFISWFFDTLIWFMNVCGEYFDEEFARSNEDCQRIYGFRNKEFFVIHYKYDPSGKSKEESYEEARKRLAEVEKIPFNKTKANE